MFDYSHQNILNKQTRLDPRLKTGKLENWTTRKMEKWKNGKLENKYVVIMDPRLCKQKKKKRKEKDKKKQNNK